MTRCGSNILQILDPAKPSPDMCRTWLVERVQESTFSTIEYAIAWRHDLPVQHVDASPSEHAEGGYSPTECVQGNGCSVAWQRIPRRSRCAVPRHGHTEMHDCPYNGWMPEREPNAWIPHPLRRLGGLALTLALNRLVALDPDARAAIDKLEGRRIGVHLKGPGIAFSIAARNGTLQIEPPPGAGDDGSANDFAVNATPGSLLAMALGRGDGARPAGKVEIAGDAELAHRVQQMARDYKPDFEAAFAGVFGDVAGTAIARALHDAAKWTGKGARHFRDDAVDWLREEARLTVPSSEMNTFLDDVDALHERAERLAARVARLGDSRP
jgi:ubiquinone biosynthesis protein UbiJ